MERVRVLSVARSEATINLSNCTFLKNSVGSAKWESVYQYGAVIGAEESIGTVRLEGVTFVNNSAADDKLQQLQAAKSGSSQTKFYSDVEMTVHVVQGMTVTESKTKPLEQAPADKIITSEPLQVLCLMRASVPNFRSQCQHRHMSSSRMNNHCSISTDAASHGRTTMA
jgi:hypothetical protein